jgi:plastocyanin domain-containing protein
LVAVAEAPKPPKAPSAQRVAIKIGTKGYEPDHIVVRAGVPVVLTVGKGEGCAAGFELGALGVHLDNSAGAATARLGALKPGTYTFTCSMGMVSGKLVAR